jgi:hypothetical protein
MMAWTTPPASRMARAIVAKKDRCSSHTLVCPVHKGVGLLSPTTLHNSGLSIRGRKAQLIPQMGDIRNPYNEFPGIHIPRTRVNRGKDRGSWTPTL